MQNKPFQLILALSALLAISVQAAAYPFETAWKEIIGDSQSRSVGSPANLELEEKVARLFKTSGLQNGEMKFTAPCFVSGETRMTLADGRAFRLNAMAPSFFRPGNFPEKEFEARLVYAGSGSEEDIQEMKGLELQDAIVVMDFNCGLEWQRFLRFGVRGFVFIDNESVQNSEAVAKTYATEVRVPRFHISSSDGEILKEELVGKNLSARIEAQPSIWKNQTVRDLWVIVPGRSKADEAVLVTAPLDASGIVPSLAQGAQNGANLLLMLNMFREYQANPPERTTIFAAVNAHSQYFRGERHLAWNLLQSRAVVERYLDVINSDLRMEEMLLGHFRKFSLNPPTKEDSELIVALRDLMDSTTGKNFTVKEPIVDLARREVNLLKGELLQLARNKDISPEQLEKRRMELEDLRHHYVNVLTLFNKVGIRTSLEELDHKPFLHADGTPGKCEHPADFEVSILRNFVKNIVDTRTKWSTLNRGEIAQVTENNAIREALGKCTVKFVLTLDLDWGNRNVGLAACDVGGSARWQHKFGLNAARIAAALPQKPEYAGIEFVDAMTRKGGYSEGHFFPKAIETPTVFQATENKPAFSIRNVFTDFGTRFSTADRFENLDHACVSATISYVTDYVRALLDDEDVTKPSELPRTYDSNKNWFPAWGTQVKAYRYDDFSASVLPQLPVPGAVLVLHDPRDAQQVIRAGDVFTGYTALTDERAVASFPAINALSLNTNSFQFDKDFIQVKSAIDAGEAETKMSSTISRGTQSKTLALFHCIEYPVYTRDNPAMIGVTAITENSFLVLNGRLNSAPKKFGMTGISSTFSTKLFNQLAGPVAFYLEEGEPLKLLTSQRVLALHADKESPLGEGFQQPAQIGSDYFETAAQDMSVLNEDRMKKLAGTSDELASIFKKRGDEAIKTAEEAKDTQDWSGYLHYLHLAIGSHLKAYQRMTAVTNDMLKAVVFYLALMLPFCFFAEKLLFKFKKIEHEMFAFCGAFALTFLVFRQIHPAFRVAQAPEAIFIAFVMGGLGLFVIKILHGRFEGEMQLLFRTASVFDTGQAGFSTVGQSAMLIGVNNMKRRRIRTALTTATIVLVTFTMLAFTSISKNLSPTIVKRSSNPPYTGLMYHWPGNSRMDEATVRTLQEILADRAEVSVRRWLLPQKVADSELPFRLSASNGNQATVDAFLGLSLKEDGFMGKVPLTAGRFFSSDDAFECIIPEALAKALGIDLKAWEHVSINIFGGTYQVVGVLDDIAFHHFRDINQRPIIPIKSQVRQASGDQDLTAMAAGEDEGDDDGVFYTDMSALVLLPIQTCKTIGGQPYSLSAKLKEEVPIWPVVDELLTITNASKFYISSQVPFQVGEGGKRTTESGVYYIGEGYRTSIGGLAFLLIPLLISSTIILNTMLGAVFERKAEIAIYNAVGLNPTHIGMFFLAEAFVYSVIGSVGGYLIGQCTSLLLTKTGLVKDLNLNFSSLSVVYVILFTVAVVLLSTIYPSMVATRAAVPSGKRKWSLPPNDGRVMPVVFPFIYQKSLIYGINAYLDEYFSRFTEASFGDLIATFQSAKTSQDEHGNEVLELKYLVALAPFDLGVTEELLFRIAYDDKVQAYRLVMVNTRMSGQDSNWIATNMPFLEKMRTYLMYWRNLSAAEHSDFNRKGQKLFQQD